ncbi:hypothetical protein [Floridanema fluviatile]
MENCTVAIGSTSYKTLQQNLNLYLENISQSSHRQPNSQLSEQII